MSSSELERLPKMPLVQCKPWCEYQDGHPDNTCREDQWCASVEVHLPMFYGPERSVELQYNYANTYVMQRPCENPKVYLGIGDFSGMEFTVDESVDLAIALLRQAENVRRGTRS